MIRGRSPDRRGRRRGAAAVEMAVLLPLLLLILVITVDFARVMRDVATVTTCARNAALFAAAPSLFDPPPYASPEEAALADAAGLGRTPTVVLVIGTDAEGQDYVEATVTSTFQTTIRFPGIPEAMEIGRTIRMPVAP